MKYCCHCGEDQVILCSIDEETLICKNCIEVLMENLGEKMRRKTPVEFILLCDECDQITTGESVETYAQTRESPAEWESRGCCGEEFIDLEEEFNERTARELYENWYKLENSSEYEERIQADGYIKAIQDIVENK